MTTELRLEFNGVCLGVLRLEDGKRGLCTLVSEALLMVIDARRSVRLRRGVLAPESMMVAALSV